MKDQKPKQFGHTFVCVCCDEATLAGYTGLQRIGSEAFLLPLAKEPEAWTKLVEELESSGNYRRVTLCGKCGQ